MLEPGTRIDGRYEVLGLLGEGGMARVLRAVDRKTGERVAVKVPRIPGPPRGGWARRFAREVAATTACSHPNVVRALDSGESDGVPYLVMEFVPGETLRSLLDREMWLSPAQALDYVRQLLAGLGHAHARGFVHRDVSPRNVLIEPSGRVRLTDFGIVQGVDDVTLTKTGEWLGTVGYTAPERLRGEEAGPAGDLYSVGALLYEMLTGRPPFRGETAIQTALMHVQDPPVPPSSLRPGLAAELDRLVLQALAKNPRRRFSSSEAMLLALGRLTTRTSEIDATLVRALPCARRSRSWWLALPVLGLALAVVLLGRPSLRELPAARPELSLVRGEGRSPGPRGGAPSETPPPAPRPRVVRAESSPVPEASPLRLPRIVIRIRPAED